MKRFVICATFSICTFFNALSAKFREDYFEQLGDALTLMPLFVSVVSIGIEDYRGARDQLLGALATQLTINSIKSSLVYAHKKGAQVSFAKRPGFDSWDGFPSGHSGGGFSAASFVYYRYGFKPAIFPIISAFVTAASRVHAKKHSLLQVTAGGLIAWAWGAYFTDNYQVRITTALDSKNLALFVEYKF